MPWRYTFRGGRAVINLFFFHNINGLEQNLVIIFIGKRMSFSLFEK